MGDIFQMPHKIEVILNAMKALVGMLEGIDPGSRDHDLIAQAFNELKIRLRDEIDNLAE